MSDETTETEIENLEDLTPDPRNTNEGTERGQYMLEHSLEQFGAGRSVVVDKEGRIIAGNKTVLAAAERGFEAKVVQTNGHELVVVQRTDLDLLGEDERARLLAYADNRSSEVGLAWDAEAVVLDLESGLDLSDLFRDDELEEIEKQAALLEELDEALAGEYESGKWEGLTGRKSIKPVLYVNSLSIFEEAMSATGEKVRGDALMEICRYYLKGLNGEDTEGQLDL